MLLLLFFIPLVVGDYPFRNISLPWDDRVNDLVGRLTLDEIILQMSRGGEGAQAGPAPAIPRLDIKPYSWDTECLRGDVGAGDATSFPQAIGLGASFSPDLIFRVAQATGEEVRAKYNNYTKYGSYGDRKGISCFSPVINIARDPRWGRNQVRDTEGSRNLVRVGIGLKTPETAGIRCQTPEGCQKISEYLNSDRNKAKLTTSNEALYLLSFLKLGRDKVKIHCEIPGIIIMSLCTYL